MRLHFLRRVALWLALDPRVELDTRGWPPLPKTVAGETPRLERSEEISDRIVGPATRV
jgi:hypothetical protein